MQIRPLDATDPAAMAAWHATSHAAHVFGLEHASPRVLEEVRAGFLSDSPGERVEPFGGYVDGVCVATGLVEMPMMDNRHLAFLDVAVHPDHRRRGHGSVMLAHLTGRAEAQGRSTLTAQGAWAYDAPADGAGTPG